MKELIPLATLLVEKIAYDNDKIKVFVQRDWMQVEVLRSVYQTLVNTKEIAPIEDLSEEEKKRLKGIVKMWGTGDTANRMMQARVLYLIENFQEKKIELQL